MQAQTGRTFNRFLVIQILIFGTSFVIAYLGATYLLSQIGGLIIPIAALLPAPANDPFWILYIMIWAGMSIIVAGVRYKTGSKL